MTGRTFIFVPLMAFICLWSSPGMTW